KVARARLLFGLGEIGRDPEAIAAGKKVIEQAMTDPASVDHDLAAVALRLTARNGDEAFYKLVMDRLSTAKSPEEHGVLQQTLTDFTDPKLEAQTLEYLISSNVRSQDSPLLLGRLVRHPETSKQAWEFVKAHWAEIDKMGGAFASGVIVNDTGSFCD